MYTIARNTSSVHSVELPEMHIDKLWKIARNAHWYTVKDWQKYINKFYTIARNTALVHCIELPQIPH